MSFISKIGSLASTAYGWAATVAAFVTDPYFEYTTLLLPGNGTNLANNNTFLDSSSNTFTVTRNPATGPNAPTQGTFSPFSQTGWGNYFSGTSGQYLNTVANAAFNFGTSDFTVEAWVFPTSTAGTRPIVEIRTTGGANGFALLSQSGATTLNVFTNGGFVGASTNSITTNQWNHVALVRSVNTWYYYINGQQSGSFSNSSTQSDGATTGPKIGGSTTAGEVWVGYLSNVRIVKGVAVYTGNFTPPTSPLTATQSAGTNISAITGTQTSLLTCQSNRFVDNSVANSGTGFAITVNGSPSVQAFSPFNPTSSWSAATNGGSGYFDGTGDYLTLPNNAAFAAGTSDFSLDAWIYTTSASSTSFIITDTRNADDDLTGFLFYRRGTGKLAFGYWAPGFTVTEGATTINSNTWYYVAATRVSNTLRLFVNGVLDNSPSTVSANFTRQSNMRIGASWTGGDAALGYLANFRLVKGGIPSLFSTSSTTSGTLIFTPPTSPTTSSDSLTAGSLSLLLNFTNAGIYDATSKNDLETVGNARISTAISAKWGSGSMYFDGTGDWLLIPDQPIQRIGTGNFTIEGWVYRNSSGTYGLIGKGTGTTGWLVSLNSSNQVVFTYGSSTITSTGTVSATTWTHIAVVREGTSTNQTKIYINGTNDGTGTVSTDFNQTNSMYVGADRTGGSAANAYMQDVRVTNYARYTSNFTAPTAAFPTL